MEYYFQNVAYPDIRAMTEVRYRVGAAKYWCWVGLYFLLAARYVWYFVLGYGYLSMVFFLIAGLLYLLLLPWRNARKVMKQYRLANNGALPQNTVWFGEKIWLEGNDFTRTWEYHNLARIYSLRYCYCLRFTDKSGFLLSRNSFTKGTFEEFKQFLRYKRPDLKIPE